MRRDRQSLWQYRQGQRVGYEHRRSGGCRLHGIRTLCPERKLIGSALHGVDAPEALVDDRSCGSRSVR